MQQLRLYADTLNNRTGVGLRFHQAIQVQEPQRHSDMTPGALVEY
jgi:hypothetical protein